MCFSGQQIKELERQVHAQQVNKARQKFKDKRIEKVFKRFPQNRSKRQQLNQSMLRTVLEGGLENNNRSRQQYIQKIKKIDSVSSFEQCNQILSDSRLDLTNNSIQDFFESLLDQNEDIGELVLRLSESCQIYFEAKKYFKFITLNLNYFLQQIEKGMSGQALRMDQNFQNRKRSLHQNEPDLWYRIQAILSKQTLLRKQSTENQQKISRLSVQIKQIRDYLLIETSNNQIFSSSSSQIHELYNMREIDLIKLQMRKYLAQIHSLEDKVQQLKYKQAAGLLKNASIINGLKKQLQKSNEAYKRLANEMQQQRQQIRLYMDQLNQIDMTLQDFDFKK